MDSSVALQPWMSFPIWMIAVGIAGAVLFCAVLVLTIRSLVPERKLDGKDSFDKVQKAPPDLKMRYETELLGILDRFERSEISPRECGELASSCVRKFASEVTGEDYSNLTLHEIGRMSGVPGVEIAVAKCYGTEFPKVPISNAREAVEECLKVVRSWR